MPATETFIIFYSLPELFTFNMGKKDKKQIAIRLLKFFL